MSVDNSGTLIGQSPAPFQASAATKTTLGLLPFLALSAALTGPSFAQTAQTTPPKPAAETVVTNAEGEIVLDDVNIDGGAGSGPNTLESTIGVGRLPGTVQDTPQVVNVVTQQMIQQQQAQTLDQVLRNVPGVTLVIGEGGGGFNGSNFRIRGFQAQTDIYVDGLRDFGTYTRDSFNMESVEVLKGPSSESFGMGTTGGAINTSSKQAVLDNFVNVTGSGGNGPLGRATIDVNRQINDTTAFRVNGMVHGQDIVDRDEIQSNRWGIAATVGLGIGTDLEYNLSFFHQTDKRVPDYGIPVFAAGTYGSKVIDVGLPSSEFGVRRSNFYGLDIDADDSQVDMLTGRLEYTATDWLTIYNDTRVSYYDRYFSPEAVGCNAACITNYFNGLPATVTRGGPSPYDQDGWAIQNVTTAVAEFETGQFRHELITGLDMLTQGNTRYTNSYMNGSVVGTRPTTDLVNPDPSTDLTVERNGGYTKSDASNIGIFASDRVWLNEQFSVLGGVRWDWYSVDSDVRTADNAATNPGAYTHSDEQSTLFNPKASLIWEPTDNQTYYLSWAKSSAAPGMAVSTATGTPGGAVGSNAEPEEAENFEIGGKVSFLDNRLGLSGAIFQTTKENVQTEVDGEIVNTGEEQRIKGFELGLAGQITDYVTATIGYTYLDSEILSAFSSNLPNPLVIGNQVQYVPKNSASAWVTYDATRHIEDKIGGKLVVGTGLTYRSKVYLNNLNTSIAPSSFSWDAMISYEKENFRIALNVNNITDELNYDQLWTNRVIPSSGRTFLVTAGASF